MSTRKRDFSKLVICLIIFLNVVFTLGMFFLYWWSIKKGVEITPPDSLIYSWFAFTGTELGFMCGIKVVKVRHGDNPVEMEDDEDAEDCPETE